MSKHPIWQAKSPTVVASSSFGEGGLCNEQTPVALPGRLEGAHITSFTWDGLSAADSELRELSLASRTKNFGKDR